MALQPPLRPTAAADPAFAQFDDIIDVRSPAEFAEDHLPGAINLPVLDDAERAQVGTIYKQVSPFDARKLGAALVAVNSGEHLRTRLSDRDGAWHPLIYCWRGGQRSGSFATILAQIGWRVTLLEGGYKAWRTQVISRVHDLGIPSQVIVLDGNTGSGKTAILARLAARGHQVIDLEGLANHRGSLFGARGAQPSQKMFEGELAAAIEALDPKKPVWLEAESSKIGDRGLPSAVWAALRAAPRLVLEVPVAARAAFSARDYADAVADPARLDVIFRSLARMHSADRLAQWQSLRASRDWEGLAASLMKEHYDPRYARHRARNKDLPQITVPLASLNDLDAAASLLAARAGGLLAVANDTP